MRHVLLPILLAAAASAQAQVDPRQQLGALVRAGDFAGALEVAQQLEPLALRLGTLADLARAHTGREGLRAARPTIDALVAATAAVEPAEERALRLAALAWFHERKLVDRWSRRKGDLHPRSAELLAQATEVLAGCDPQQVAALVARGDDGGDRIYNRIIYLSARAGLPDADEAELGREAISCSAAITGVASAGARAFLLAELANVARFLGDDAKASAALGQAARAAGEITELEPRLMTRRALANAAAASGSIAALQEVAPDLLTDLGQMPAQYAPTQLDWLLELAELQRGVDARRHLPKTLERADAAFAAARDRLPAAKLPAVRDRLDQLWLVSGDAERYLARVAAAHPVDWRRAAHLDAQLRWLFGLPAKDDHSPLAGIGGREPSLADLATALTVLPAIPIDGEPFAPYPGRAAMPDDLSGRDQARDELCSRILAKALELGHRDVAHLLAMRIVRPRRMGSALLDIAESLIAADERDRLARVLRQAQVCYDTDKQDLLPDRGSKAVRLGLAWHAAGDGDRARAALRSAEWIIAGEGVEDVRARIGARIAAAYAGIGASRRAWQTVEAVLAAAARSADPAAARRGVIKVLERGGFDEAARSVARVR
ncbi:MAG: hypothetical protein KAI24_13185 [Planctomycetes bacterium]|nr:hypothetical protein [Planctomycetota bacterium]